MQPSSTVRQVLEQTAQHALHYLENLEQSPIAATSTLTELRLRLSRPLSDNGCEPLQVIDDLVADSAGGILGSAGGRFFAWVIGGVLPAALAADWLTSTWDQNAAIYACGPAEAVIEEVCGCWLKQLLGLPASASFALTTGSQMAHVTCLAAARNAVLARWGWDVEQKGLFGAPSIRILSSTERHGSTERAIRLLGLGRESLVDLPTDELGCLQATTLVNALQEEHGKPIIVLLQAGDLNIGAFDPFAELIPLAHQYNAWVHIDGAFGLWVAASPHYRHLLRGAEQADSWVTDGHKWLNTPYDAGYAFVIDSDAHRNSISHRASYTYHIGDARDQIDWNPEWSRRGRGVATYAAIRQLGKTGIADLVERCCRHAHTLVTQIGALPGAEIVWTPQVNQGLVRFLSPNPSASEIDHDQQTDKVIAEIWKVGEAFFGGTTWRGKRCMRISVVNWQTNDQDVERAIAAVEQAIQASR